MSQQKVGGVKIRLEAASNELLLSNGGDETKHRLRLETTEWRQLAPNVEMKFMLKTFLSNNFNKINVLFSISASTMSLLQ